MSDISPTKPDDSNPANSLNPYATPLSAISVVESHPGQQQNSVVWLLLWTLLVPALVANALFWIYYWLDLSIFQDYMRSYGTNFLIYIATVVPFVGVLYGVVIGYVFHRRPLGKYKFLNPFIQGLFQPFWFVISVTAGCFAVFPIVGGF